MPAWRRAPGFTARAPTGLPQAAKRLELAALRLVEEQEGLVAAARQRQPRRQPQPAPSAPSQGAPVLPSWQLGGRAGAAAAGKSMQRAEPAGWEAATERQHRAASEPSGEGQDAGGQLAAGAVLPYDEYVEQALLLLGKDGEPLLCTAQPAGSASHCRGWWSRALSACVADAVMYAAV